MAKNNAITKLKLCEIKALKHELAVKSVNNRIKSFKLLLDFLFLSSAAISLALLTSDNKLLLFIMTLLTFELKLVSFCFSILTPEIEGKKIYEIKQYNTILLVYGVTNYSFVFKILTPNLMKLYKINLPTCYIVVPFCILTIITWWYMLYLIHDANKRYNDKTK